VALAARIQRDQGDLVTVQRPIALLLFAATLAFTGCKADNATQKAEVIDKGVGPGTVVTAPVAPPVDLANAGSIRGTVHFKGTAPARLNIDMSMDPACALAGDNMTEQYVVKDGKLANVYLYIKAGITPSMETASATPVVMDQKGCHYTPHVIAVQQGGSVEFRNSDSTMHNIHTVPNADGAGGVDISQAPMGQPQTHRFETPEVMLPVRCNNHPWMNAFINVAPTPYFAVTGADGSFTITGLPPGTYTLAAVHEKLGEQDVQVTVPAKSSIKSDFTFTAK